MKLKEIREMYPEGTQIVLTEMAGESQMPYGLKGTVKFVDDAGQIHMSWENGSSLALNINEDTFEKVEAPEKISVILVEPGRYPNPNTIKTSKTKGVKAMSEITYTMVGDYNLPNLKLPEQTEVTLGRWSQMRRTYLKEHHKILYYNLLTKGILNSHLAEVQQRASELEETLVKQMAQKAGLTEQMKAEDMMKWVRLMNNIRNSAQEIVKNQVIFA